MALGKGTVNPLNVVGQRRLSYQPPHFVTLRILETQWVDKIDQWIYFNLNSRYCVKVKPGLDTKRKITEICEISIEDPKELTMLSLACPYLNNNKN
jgi:hypothetical protein